jgi:hypothetical protein
MNVAYDSPVGVWSGTARHDGRVDKFTISFAPDGSVALTTAISAGEGAWSGAGDVFNFSVKEVFHNDAPLPGFVLFSIDAHWSDDRFRGFGSASVHNPDGSTVGSTFTEVEATRMSG